MFSPIFVHIAIGQLHGREMRCYPMHFILGRVCRNQLSTIFLPLTLFATERERENPSLKSRLHLSYLSYTKVARKQQTQSCYFTLKVCLARHMSLPFLRNATLIFTFTRAFHVFFWMFFPFPSAFSAFQVTFCNLR